MAAIRQLQKRWRRLGPNLHFSCLKRTLKYKSLTDLKKFLFIFFFFFEGIIIAVWVQFNLLFNFDWRYILPLMWVMSAHLWLLHWNRLGKFAFFYNELHISSKSSINFTFQCFYCYFYVRKSVSSFYHLGYNTWKFVKHLLLCSKVVGSSDLRRRFLYTGVGICSSLCPCDKHLVMALQWSMWWNKDLVFVFLFLLKNYGSLIFLVIILVYNCFPYSISSHKYLPFSWIVFLPTPILIRNWM